MIPPLAAEDIPTEAKALREELSGMLPFVPIASLLIELDARTDFLACFTHAGGRKSTQSVELKRNILAVLDRRGHQPRADPYVRGVWRLL